MAKTARERRQELERRKAALAETNMRRQELRRLQRAHVELRTLVRRIERERERAEAALVGFVRAVVAETGHVLLTRDELAELRNRAEEADGLRRTVDELEAREGEQPAPVTV